MAWQGGPGASSAVCWANSSEPNGATQTADAAGGSFKYKSRWCVLVFDDLDSENLRAFAPTPQAEIINLFFQTTLNLRPNAVFGDVTSA